MGERQAAPVLPLGCGIDGLPVVVDRLGVPARLVGVATEPRVAAGQRAPDVVPPALGLQVSVLLARGRDLALLIEREGLARRAGVRVVAPGRGDGRSDLRQTRLRNGDGGVGGRRSRDFGRLLRLAGFPPARHGRAAHQEEEDRSQRQVHAGQVPAAPRRGIASDRGSGGGRGAGSAAGPASADGTGTRGSRWHFGHRSVPSGRLAQQDRQNIGRGAGRARARAPGGTGADRTRPVARSRRAP